MQTRGHVLKGLPDDRGVNDKFLIAAGLPSMQIFQPSDNRLDRSQIFCGDFLRRYFQPQLKKLFFFPGYPQGQIEIRMLHLDILLPGVG